MRQQRVQPLTVNCADVPQFRVQQNTLIFNDAVFRCAVGRGGIVAAEKKREGDGCTPAGTWRLRECWYRADRLSQAPVTALPLKVIQKNDGWCDDPAHPLYNRHFIISSPLPTPLPHAGEGTPQSFEHLWREDHAYDLVVPLGYNDDPVVPGRGSAIFLHVAAPDYAPTEGCVALLKPDLLAVLAAAVPPTDLRVDAAAA